MTPTRYKYVQDENGATIAALIEGELFTATDRNPGFQGILDALRESAPATAIRELFDATLTVARRFEALSERVTLAGGRLYFDGDLIDNALTDQVLRFIDEGREDWRPLVNFFEKVSLNPNAHSREQLFDWLSRHEFAITPDGDFVAYKGVNSGSEKAFQSVSGGPAVVNGVPHTSGPVQQNIGDVVEMARSRVHHDPTQGCSVGLHVGDYSYASNFGHSLLLVKVNPRDVVSVPTDCEWRKMRVCRYTVIEEIPRSRQLDSAYYEYEDEGDWEYQEPEDIHTVL
jgi:hypothetical protein